MGLSNPDDLSRLGLLSPDHREIDLDLKGDVEIVREDVECHMGGAVAPLK